jgi:hypothetical protein
MRSSRVTPITFPANIPSDWDTLSKMASCSWLHGVLRLFDVLTGRLLFRRLVDGDVQYLTISTRLGLSAYDEQQRAYPETDPDYHPGVAILIIALNWLEPDHCSKAIAADYANATLAAGLIKLAWINRRWP